MTAAILHFPAPAANTPTPDRAALIFEAAQKHGLTHEGKLIPGVTGAVSFDGRRGAKGGGIYTVKLIRDPDKSDQARLPKESP